MLQLRNMLLSIRDEWVKLIYQLKKGVEAIFTHKLLENLASNIEINWNFEVEKLK